MEGLGPEDDMTELFVIIVPALIVGALCRKRGTSAPFPLVVTGAAIGALPIVDRFRPDPDVLLAAVLPPLLFGAALSASYVGIRRNLTPIAALSVGLVLATAATVAFAAHAVTPELPIAAALTLGAILAPADAVATAAVARKVGMKRQTQTLLDGENLLNDGTALTIFNVGVAIVLAGSVTAREVTGIIAMSVIGGAVLGLVGGFVLRMAIERIDDAVIESAIILVTPYVIFFLCELLGASGFLAVVLAGLVLSRSVGRGSALLRLNVVSLWSVLTFLMESVAFVLVGFEFTSVLSDDGLHLLRESGPMILAVLVAIVVTRLVWVMGLVSLPRVRRRVTARSGSTKDAATKDAAVVAWASMRGPVSVFAAMAIPLTLDDGSAWPMRDELILVTTCIVIATLVAQGMTLGPLMRRLGVAGHVDHEGIRAEAETRKAAHAAAEEALQGVLRKHPELHPEVVRRLERHNNDGLPLKQVHGLSQAEQTAYRDALLTMIDAERAVCLRRRADGDLDEEAARRLIQRLDLQEVALELD